MIPDKYIKEYYSDSSTGKIVLKFLRGIGSARSFVQGSSFIFSYYNHNFIMFALLFLIAEANPTEVSEIIEKLVHGNTKNLLTSGAMVTTYKYASLVLISCLYFRWTLGINWKRVSYESSDTIDTCFR